MYSSDIIFAKINFPADIAGNYAVLSTLGKILLFSILAIGNVMFPISYEKYIAGKKENTYGVLKKTILVVSALILIAAIATVLFSKQVILLLFGSSYLAFSGLLFYVCI